jgi:hypothetical protein
VPAILNRITVHHGLAQLQRWASQTRTHHGIKDLVLVGGETSRKTYGGVSVENGLEGLFPHSQGHGGRLGVVTIPTRRRPDLDEPERLLRKRRAGASFAISQILAGPEAAISLHDDASTRFAQEGEPFRIYWSLAPVAKPRDLDFLDWLGVKVPAAARQDLLGGSDPTSVLRRSHGLNEAWARAILEAAETRGGLEVGFCIEHVMQSNVCAAIDLVDRVAALVKEFRLAPVLPPSSVNLVDASLSRAGNTAKIVLE